MNEMVLESHVKYVVLEVEKITNQLPTYSTEEEADKVAIQKSIESSPTGLLRDRTKEYVVCPLPNLTVSGHVDRLRAQIKAR